MRDPRGKPTKTAGQGRRQTGGWGKREWNEHGGGHGDGDGDSDGGDGDGGDGDGDGGGDGDGDDDETLAPDVHPCGPLPGPPAVLVAAPGLRPVLPSASPPRVGASSSPSGLVAPVLSAWLHTVVS